MINGDITNEVFDADNDGWPDVWIGNSDHNHGSVGADFDRDGDLENLTNDDGASNWVQLQLEGNGVDTNRAAIGARVRVTAGPLTQTQEVSGGGGQWGDQTDLVLHYGLGGDCAALVEVRWPDAAATTETFTVVGGGRYRLVQGSGEATPL